MDEITKIKNEITKANNLIMLEIQKLTNLNQTKVAELELGAEEANNVGALQAQLLLLETENANLKAKLLPFADIPLGKLPSIKAFVGLLK